MFYWREQWQQQDEITCDSGALAGTATICHLRTHPHTLGSSILSFIFLPHSIWWLLLWCESLIFFLEWGLHCSRLPQSASQFYYSSLSVKRVQIGRKILLLLFDTGPSVTTQGSWSVQWILIGPFQSSKLFILFINTGRDKLSTCLSAILCTC